jgi:3-oxoacyl-[acyl-carrier-protein] synthase I
MRGTRQRPGKPAGGQSVTPGWLRPLKAERAPRNPRDQPLRPLRIASRGMCCAVGHNARAATAAIRARMNHFRDTEFVGSDGLPIIGAHLYAVDLWGEERLRLMLRSVLAECLVPMPDLQTEEIGIVLLTANAEGHGQAQEELAKEIECLRSGTTPGLGTFHAQSQLCAYGKAGIARALMEAERMLTLQGGPKYVALATVDSLLHAAAIERYLAYGRIATPSNPDGFIPAEGAAALLLTRENGAGPALWIDSCATAEEAWRIDKDLPLRANALTEAIRNAASLAGTEVAALHFHASGMNGEGWYAKEVSLALTRALERRAPNFAHHMIARSVGETGAAAPVLSLAWLADAMGRGTDGPGHSALLHFAEAEGQRAALIVRFRSGNAEHR